MAKERLVVIDGHALIHRAYHAIPPLTIKSGELVNAVYGFTTILLNVIRDLKPKYLVVAFDLPGKTKRHEEYKEYKANRVKAPDDLVGQFQRVREVVQAFDIPIFEYEGYEADDVIGTLAKKAPGNIETIIVTGDMDELQLVDERTKVYTMRRGFTDTVIYDEAGVKAKYNLTPSQFVDYKALKGDPSDNIPGVTGVGEKTASDLISTYGSLDNIYDSLDQLKPRLAEKLKEEKEIAYLSQRLSRIETGLPIEVDLSCCMVHQYNRQTVFSLFGELEFRSLLSKIPGEDSQPTEAGEEPKKVEGRYHHLETREELAKLIEKLQGESLVAVNITATGSPHQAEITGIGLAYKEGEGYYLSGDDPEMMALLKPFFEDQKISKIGHNLKTAYILLKKRGIQLNSMVHDTMIAAYLVNPNAKGSLLSELAFAELGLSLTMEQEDGSGCDTVLRLYHHLTKMLEERKLAELLERIEMPLIPILAEMEMTGITLHTPTIQALSKYASGRLEHLEAAIKKRSGEDFNIASPSQLQNILFDKLRLQDKLDNPKELKKLKTGGYSTAASELEKLRTVDPIIEDIFEYRELSKLKNTYIDVLPKLVSPTDGRLHTCYNQAVAQTGRLSSSDPNLQNIPVRTEFGKKIREAFVADPGYLLLSADYSQIELRVIAHIAQDKTMAEIFRHDRDIHTETAASVYNISDKKVTPQMRRIAKIINFGIIYGVSAHGLRQQTGVTYEEGRELIKKYFEIHPAIKEYSDKMIEQAKKSGYVETIFGRRRYLPQINSSNFALRGAAERMAINMPIQGTAADLIKLAMIEIASELPKISPKTRMLLQVHDELVFEVPEGEIERVAKFIKERMNGVVKLDVPIETSVSWGKNWGEAK